MCSNAIAITISTMWDRRVHSLLNKTLPVYSVLVFLTPTNQNKTATAKLKNSSSPQTSWVNLSDYIYIVYVSGTRVVLRLFVCPATSSSRALLGRQ